MWRATFLGKETQARIAVVEKPYVGTPHANRPDAVIIGREQDQASKPVGGDADVFVKNLLPDLPGFDMAMNIMTFRPGAALSLVEVHLMEHGLLMLDGSLLYRLGDAYFPVQTGDVTYMAPFCPQWCAAFGKQTAVICSTKTGTAPRLSIKRACAQTVMDSRQAEQQHA
jgi:(S)-ureidoglycine aminohydrolase